MPLAFLRIGFFPLFEGIPKAFQLFFKCVLQFYCFVAGLMESKRLMKYGCEQHFNGPSKQMPNAFQRRNPIQTDSRTNQLKQIDVSLGRTGLSWQ